MTRFDKVIAALKEEEALLAAQIGKVRDAMAALGGVPAAYQRRQRVRAVKRVVTNARQMTAEQKAEVSRRMKAYWLKRKKAQAKAKPEG